MLRKSFEEIDLYGYNAYTLLCRVQLINLFTIFLEYQLVENKFYPIPNKFKLLGIL